MKTDPRDARKLARLLAGGPLEPIHVPRRSWKPPATWYAPARMRASTGCVTGTASRSSVGSRRSTRRCTRSISSTAGSSSWSGAIAEVAEQGPWRELVARLRRLRGVDTLTALALVAETGDFSRFRSAEEFMALVGFVPSERSSGEKRRQGSITKVGNSHVRRLLVETARHARGDPRP